MARAAVAAAATRRAACRRPRLRLRLVLSLGRTAGALHYLPDVDRVLAGVRRALAPGGVLVASVEHPIHTAPSRPGFAPGPAGRPVWPLDGYLDPGPRTTDWLAPGVVKHHRTVEGYVEALLTAGFTLTGLREWGPTPEQVAEHPEWAAERERPLFLLLSGVVATVAP